MSIETKPITNAGKRQHEASWARDRDGVVTEDEYALACGEHEPIDDCGACRAIAAIEAEAQALVAQSFAKKALEHEAEAVASYLVSPEFEKRLAAVLMPAMFDKGYQNPKLFAKRIVARLLEQEQ